MTWLYVLIDVFILLLVVALILVVLYFWNKKRGLTPRTKHLKNL